MRAFVLAGALACVTTAAEARTLKELFRDDVHALIAVDIETLKRDVGKVSVDVYFVMPAPKPTPVGDKTVLIETDIIQMQYDCPARKVRALGDTMEDLTSSYPGDVGVHDWTAVDPGSPSDSILTAVCPDPPRLPAESFATVAQIAAPYRQAIATHRQATPPAD